MSKVTVVSRPNRITIASKGVQGAPGPEGPRGLQGLRGEKGDTGDVTPEALAARDAAVGAASAAAGSAGAADGAAEARVQALRSDLSDPTGGAGLVGFRQAGAGAASRSVADKLRDSISILDFIPPSEHAAIRDGVSTYDCHPAIMAAIESTTFSAGTWYDAAKPILFPPGKYLCNSTIQLKKWVKFYGHQARTIAAPTIVFPAGVTGIIIHRFNTMGGGTVPPSKAADCSVIEGLRLIGGGAHATQAHGIWVRAGCVLRDLWINGFSGDGISVQATAGGGGATEGNSNGFQISNVRCHSNGRHGIYVDGADANAGLVSACDASYNGGWGFYESSFLGNTYIACHADGNGTGGYKSDVTNMGSVFIGCYVEGSGAIDAPAPNLWIGGQIMDGYHNLGCLMRGTLRGIEMSGIYTPSADGSVKRQIGKTAGGTSAIDMIATVPGNVWRLKAGGVGHLMWDRNNFGNSDFIHYYDRDNATVANGYLRDLTTWGGYGGVPLGLPRGYLGANMTARIDDFAAPTTGTWRRGDIVFGLNATAGGKIGFVCTTAGTAGSTAVFKQFGAIDA